MKNLFVLFIILFIAQISQAQVKGSPRLVGGPCEGCEAIFEYKNRKLSPVDTLVDFNEDGIKLKITGTIFQPDGKTPAEDIIIYIYHTNQNGIYPTRGSEAGWERRHGYLRGWVKTDKSGEYTFYTLRPGTYPNRATPAHIHITILEPDGRYYWIGSYHFEDDPLLTVEKGSPTSPRGGSSGVLILREENNTFVGERDIILGLNISGYD